MNFKFIKENNHIVIQKIVGGKIVSSYCQNFASLDEAYYFLLMKNFRPKEIGISFLDAFHVIARINAQKKDLQNAINQ